MTSPFVPMLKKIYVEKYLKTLSYDTTRLAKAAESGIQNSKRALFSFIGVGTPGGTLQKGVKRNHASQ